MLFEVYGLGEFNRENILSENWSRLIAVVMVVFSLGMVSF